ncbi:MAG: substrate-binding domain-containing protein [Oribacterium sp.]|jgi:ribose transport system substrate-binding protein|nr:substrate-binding domain-containing protein [Oribacterium sp.]
MKKKHLSPFIIAEAELALAVIITMLSLSQSRQTKKMRKVAVIIENSGDDDWNSLRYGIRQAVLEKNITPVIMNTADIPDAAEQDRLIDEALAGGAEAVIVKPAPGINTKSMLEGYAMRIPVMLIESDSLAENPMEQSGPDLIPVVEPDQQALGAALADAVLEDYDGSLNGRKLGIIEDTPDTSRAKLRRQGFIEALAEQDYNVAFDLTVTDPQWITDHIKHQSDVDIIVCLNAKGLEAAGQAAKNGAVGSALVYGIANSERAAFYLDQNAVQCLVVPDEMSVGYESMQEMAARLQNPFHELKGTTTEFTVVRRDTMFSEQNQFLLFSQTSS